MRNKRWEADNVFDTWKLDKVEKLLEEKRPWMENQFSR